jgi:hypothetical protein
MRWLPHGREINLKSEEKRKTTFGVSLLQGPRGKREAHHKAVSLVLPAQAAYCPLKQLTTADLLT